MSQMYRFFFVSEVLQRVLPVFVILLNPKQPRPFLCDRREASAGARGGKRGASRPPRREAPRASQQQHGSRDACGPDVTQLAPPEVKSQTANVTGFSFRGVICIICPIFSGPAMLFVY